MLPTAMRNKQLKYAPRVMALVDTVRFLVHPREFQVG